MTDDRMDRRPPDAAPADPDEALNAALDGHAPAPPGEVAEMLAIARMARATPLDAGEDAPPERLASLWDGILGASRPKPVRVPSQAVGVAFAAETAGPVPGWMPRGRSGLRAVTSWVSMAAVIAVLIGMGSMAWSLRPGGGDHRLLASATSLAVGTASASPSPVATPTWMRWPVREDCDAAPMSHADYAALMSAQPDISGRSYAVAGVPARAEAEAAADVARRQFACEAFSEAARVRTLSSPAYTFFQSASMARTASEAETLEADLAHGMLLSATIDPQAPSAYVGSLDGTIFEIPGLGILVYFETEVQLPDGTQTRVSLAFDPVNAVALADGRIAIPSTMLGFEINRRPLTAQQRAALDVVAPPLYVMAQESGRWVVDEVLTYCPFVGCGPVWAWLAAEGGIAVPALALPGPLPWTLPPGAATATPVASPAHGGTATPAT